MGEGLLRHPAPTGYPETRDGWLSTAALWSRLDVCADFPRLRALGLEGDPLGLFPSDEDVATRAEAIVLGRATPETRAAVVNGVGQLDRPRQQKLLALALYLGSPEFQRQ
jgi:hypothetical protein